MTMKENSNIDHSRLIAALEEITKLVNSKSAEQILVFYNPFMIEVDKSPQPPETSTQGQAPPQYYGQRPPPTYIQPPPPPPPPPPPTVIIVQQPPQLVQVPSFVTVTGWSTGLYDCSSDVPNCVMTILFPCVTFGQIAEIVDQGSIPCEACAASYAVILVTTGLPCMKSCAYRSKMRRQYNLPEDPCNDICVHFCCEFCALCQEYRELKNRGFDMFLGWQGNQEKQNQEPTTTAPSVHGGMYR